MDFKDLSPELREKAKACKTPEDMLTLAKAEGYKPLRGRACGRVGGR